MARRTRNAEGTITGVSVGTDDIAGNNGIILDAANGEPSGAETVNEYLSPGDIGGNQGSNAGSDGGIAGEPIRKRRGRKPGSTYAKKSETISVDGLASIIFSAHAMLAGMTRSQELMLEPTEATQLAQATANVSRHYGVAMAAKTVDWINLAMVAGGIYGTRLIALRMRRQSERPQKQQQVRPVEVKTNSHVDPMAPRPAPDQPQPDFAEFSSVYGDN